MIARRRRRWVVALVVALCVEALVLASRLVLAPIHARHEKLQPLLSPVQAVASLLDVPGKRASFLVKGQKPHGYDGLRPWVSMATNLAFYGVATLVVTRWILGRRAGAASAAVDEAPAPGMCESPPRSEEPQARSETESAGGSWSRREFLGSVARGGMATALVGLPGYGVFCEPSLLPVSSREFRLEGLPAELSGLRVVHLTDIYHGPWTSVAFIRAVVEKANELRPDLVLLTGDYVTADAIYSDAVGRELGMLRPAIAPPLAVLGNHDHWTGAEAVRTALKKAGIALLDNDRGFVSVAREWRSLPSGDGRGLCIAGIGDLWEDKVDFHAALSGVPEGMPRLLMSHNPDAAEHEEMKAAEPYRVDLMLAGHTHGGQIRIPLVGTPIVPSRYGQKYAQGLVQGPGCPVLVSRGIGLAVLPVRIGVPPEIGFIKLVQ